MQAAVMKQAAAQQSQLEQKRRALLMRAMPSPSPFLCVPQVIGAKQVRGKS
jgi:hypothetical protein